MEEKNADINLSLQCINCGAVLYYEPGTSYLKCNYCGTSNEIERSQKEDVRSLDFDEFVESTAIPPKDGMEAFVVQCKNCGANTTLPAGITSDTCAFCDSPLILSMAHNERILKPHYILPFLLNDLEAEKRFRQWLGNLWFAPNALIKNVKQIHRDHFKGMYLPHWAYDTKTKTTYQGQRGTYYWVTERYTTVENGQRVTRSRQVRRTRWHSVYGQVSCTFKDVLVLASHSLSRKVADRLEPWQLAKLQVFDERYMSGFRSETYSIDARQGLELAKVKMESTIIGAVRRDIGGDEQLINHHENQYSNIKLKYNLFPIWISSFKFKGKLYQIAINASTGEVIGERPYSIAKIVFAIIGFLILMAILYVLLQG
ncbi:hypothetical protein [Olivibacter sitiensis]|uniref:hypothetical protein n=1 Tax=Olivibacter sitiensis TaxID=376470 RepID=UPI000688A01F|nr:hypothetical protein [Olivibacter sitiensis]